MGTLPRLLSQHPQPSLAAAALRPACSPATHQPLCPLFKGIQISCTDQWKAVKPTTCKRTTEAGEKICKDQTSAGGAGAEPAAQGRSKQADEAQESEGEKETCSQDEINGNGELSPPSPREGRRRRDC